MCASIRSTVEESSALQSREKLQAELDLQIQRASEATKKMEEALRFREVAVDQMKASEKQLAKVEAELKKKQRELGIAEDNLAQLIESRARDIAQAVEAATPLIKSEYLKEKVKPTLKKMRERALRSGYQQGFAGAVQRVTELYPDLTEEIEAKVTYYFSDEEGPEKEVVVPKDNAPIVVPPQEAGGGQPSESPKTVVEQSAETYEPGVIQNLSDEAKGPGDGAPAFEAEKGGDNGEGVA